MKQSTHLSKNAGIYILTNTLNNKQYVGMDSNIPRRFKQHTRGIAKCGVLHEALAAVGLENWTAQFIPYPGISREALRAVEQWYIRKLGTKHPNGYNLRGGPKASPEPTVKQLKRSELKSQVRERREAGAVLETIAAEFGLSRGTVADWCKDIKVIKETVRRKAAKRRAEKNEEDAQLRIRALQRKEKGLSLRQIASELKTTRRRLDRLLKA
ncbi:MAG: GIY-YIG nuclease family protein [Candidatus Poribacteria bacterium]|nr:GIY-YIG nuclease family protein [Candidatus Poribacteria bacterium]